MHVLQYGTVAKLKVYVLQFVQRTRGNDILYSTIESFKLYAAVNTLIKLPKITVVLVMCHKVVTQSKHKCCILTI